MSRSRARWSPPSSPLPLLVALIAVLLALPLAAAGSDAGGGGEGAADQEAMESGEVMPPVRAETGGACTYHCDCPKGELCNRAGRCEGVLCPMIWAPVCGVDGHTYGNACEAEAAHVVVAHEGPCPTVCGGIQGLPCDKGQVCDLPAGICQGADLQGVCKDRPAKDDCPEMYRPVCGCDAVTYGNDCLRLAAGVQKDHDGECADGGGCDSNADCSAEDYCAFAPGTCGDQPGECRFRPEVCTKELRPVCGCDGHTYGNACAAASAGVSVRHQGAC